MVAHEPIYKELGYRLRAARETVGLTQEEMAQRLGLTLAAYNRYEQAQRRMPVAELRRAAEILGRPPSYFLGEPASPDDVALWQYASLPEHDKAFVRQMVGLLSERNKREAA